MSYTESKGNTRGKMPPLSKFLHPVYLGAFALLGAVVVANGRQAMILGDSPIEKATFVLSSLGADVMMAALPFIMIKLWAQGRAMALLAAAALMVAVGAYSGVSLLHAVAAPWDAKIARQGDTVGKRAALALRESELSSRLLSVGESRAVAVIEAELSNILLDKRLLGCTKIDGPLTRSKCPAAAALRTEAATAASVGALRDQLEAVRAEIKALPPATTLSADPTAEGMVLAASLVGIPIDANQARWAAILVTVAMLWVGAMAAPVLADSITTHPAKSVPVEARGATIALPPAVIPTVDVPIEHKSVAAVNARITTLVSLGDKERQIVQVLADLGGAIEGSDRELAEAFGPPKTTVLRAISKLSAAGQITVTKTGAGKRLALAA